LSLRVVPRVAAAGGVAVGAAVLVDLPSVVEAVLASALFVALALMFRAVPDELLVEGRAALVRLRGSRA
jgi:hypothetical protein